MSASLASVVDWYWLLDVAWVSLSAGIGVTAAFALGILGATRAVDMRRSGNAIAAAAYTVLMLLAIVAVTGAVAFALLIMAG